MSVGTVLLLGGAAPALGQVDYTGVPPTAPPPDVYVVDTYVGAPAASSPGVVTSVGAGVRPSALPSQLATGGAIFVADAALGVAPAVDEGDRRLVTGWDVVTIGALGLTAVVAFAVAAARFRSP
ncbi:MAG: hypothetical protein M3203_10410 [Actinomycetota bacterium]|nr:hypothetical protein [Actinomycetota bacterium]